MKKLLSIILTTAMLMSFTTAFAENSLTSDTDSVTISTDTLTDENVLYRAMQNDNGIALMSLDDEESEEETFDEIIADFDVVMSFDMSYSMYEYDINGEKAWLEYFNNISEEAPDGTRYAAASSDENDFADDLTTLITEQQNKSYSGKYDITSSLDECLDMFDSESDERNKVVIATAHEIDDADELEDKLYELRDCGVIPFVFVLNAKTDNSLDIDGVYQCSGDLALRVAISDLYLSFGEFSEAAETSLAAASVNTVSNDGIAVASDTDDTNDSDWYDSDLKDRYLLSENLDGGLALASVLNMYKCMPLRAVYYNSEDGDIEYDITENGTSDVETIVDFLKGNVSDLKNTDFIGDVSDLFDVVYTNVKSTSVSNEEYINIIEKNLKRHFPVIADIDDEICIISSYNAVEESIKINLQDAEIALGTISEIFDVYEYLAIMSVSANMVKTEITQDSSKLYITKSYPSDYSVEDNVVVLPEDFEEDSQKSDNILTVNADLNILSDEKLLVAATVEIENNIPNTYDSIPYYVLRLYNDVLSNDVWFYKYLLKATNLEIIEGDTDGNFNGSDSVTRCQFVKMALQAAQVPLDVETSKWNNSHWAVEYMNKAYDLDILYWDDTRDDDEIADYFDEAIPRYEAAYILKTLFMDNRENILVPTLLYEYSTGLSSIRSEVWNTYVDQFTGDSERALSSMYQLFMNDIFVGDENKDLRLTGNLSRAEATKIVTKPLFELDDDIEQIIANFENVDNVTSFTITQDGKTIDEITFDNNNTRTYVMTVDDYHAYTIKLTGSGEAVLTVVSEDGEVFKVSDTEYRALEQGTYTITIVCSDNGVVGLDITACLKPQVIEFTHPTTDADGIDWYYLYDNNLEILKCTTCTQEETQDENGDYISVLADETNCGAIAEFQELSSGKYTLFMDHNREQHLRDEDLYFDIVFISNDNDAQIQINNLAMGSDSTNVIDDLGEVTLDNCNYVWSNYKQITLKDSDTLDIINPIYKYDLADIWNEDLENNQGIINLNSNTPVFLSNYLKYNINVIPSTDIDGNVNYDGLFAMMDFYITGNNVSIYTIAYNDVDKALSNIDHIISQGDVAFYPSRQYKGKADHSPIAETSFNYTIDDLSFGDYSSIYMPTIIKNHLYPNGIETENGQFGLSASSFNPDYYNIAIESDLMELKYIDESKKNYYGSGISEDDKETIWYFDIYHSGLTNDSPTIEIDGEEITFNSSIYKTSSGENFMPNETLENVAYYIREQIENGLYKTDDIESDIEEGLNMWAIKKAIAPNLGNYGMTSRQSITITNYSSYPINIEYILGSDAGEIYYFTTDLPVEAKVDTESEYILKSSDETEERIELVKNLQPNNSVNIVLDITIITNCIAGMVNSIQISK